MDMTETASTHYSVKMVNVLQLAELMSVCPNTIRRWMREEKLKLGEHYFQNNRTIRFPWGDDLVKSLLKQSLLTVSERPKLSSTSSGRNRQLKYRV